MDHDESPNPGRNAEFGWDSQGQRSSSLKAQAQRVVPVACDHLLYLSSLPRRTLMPCDTCPIGAAGAVFISFC